MMKKSEREKLLEHMDSHAKYDKCPKCNSQLIKRLYYTQPEKWDYVCMSCVTKYTTDELYIYRKWEPFLNYDVDMH